MQQQLQQQDNYLELMGQTAYQPPSFYYGPNTGLEAAVMKARDQQQQQQKQQKQPEEQVLGALDYAISLLKQIPNVGSAPRVRQKIYEIIQAQKSDNAGAIYNILLKEITAEQKIEELKTKLAPAAAAAAAVGSSRKTRRRRSSSSSRSSSSRSSRRNLVS